MSITPTNDRADTGAACKALRDALRAYLSSAQIEALELDPVVRSERLRVEDFARPAQAWRPIVS